MIVTEEDIGTNIQYYDEGWRVGVLEGIKGQKALIKPLVLKLKRLKEIPLTDVKRIEKETNGTCTLPANRKQLHK